MHHAERLDGLRNLVTSIGAVAIDDGTTAVTPEGKAELRLVGYVGTIRSQGIREARNELGSSVSVQWLADLLENRVVQNPAQHFLVNRGLLPLVEASLEAITLLCYIPDNLDDA